MFNCFANTLSPGTLSLIARSFMACLIFLSVSSDVGGYILDSANVYFSVNNTGSHILRDLKAIIITPFWDTLTYNIDSLRGPEFNQDGSIQRMDGSYYYNYNENVFIDSTLEPGRHNLQTLILSGNDTLFNSEFYEPTIIAAACYKYRTIAEPLVCIDPEPYTVWSLDFEAVSLKIRANQLSSYTNPYLIGKIFQLYSGCSENT